LVFDIFVAEKTAEGITERKFPGWENREEQCPAQSARSQPLEEQGKASSPNFDRPDRYTSRAKKPTEHPAHHRRSLFSRDATKAEQTFALLPPSELLFLFLSAGDS